MTAPPVEVLRMVNPAPVIHPWAQYVLWAGAFVAAIAVIWAKVFRPMMNLVSAAAVLQEIVKQFRTDSGSSLRDAVNRLEEAAKAAAAALTRLDDRLYDLQKVQAQSIAASCPLKENRGIQAHIDKEGG